MDLREFLMVLQIIATLLGFFVLAYRMGQFTERVDTGLMDVRKDLADHTTKEERAFSETRQAVLDLMQARVQAETRLNYLENRLNGDHRQ